MGGVFANGLEISDKAGTAKTVAAMPDVCFTPPENPATPPGVPVPYPSFGMVADTDKGTGTVKIGGETVNIKNKSHLTKTSGTEAGSAAKKGIVTSKNTGKKYFHSWSNDVKFDGEPVIRFTDLATHNHASPGGQTPPWTEINKLTPNNLDCETVLQNFKLHRHGDNKKKPKVCPEGYQSEHFVQNEYLQWDRGKETATQFLNYTEDDAPCICMQSYTRTGGTFNSGKGSMIGSPHRKKTNQCNKAIKEMTETPTLDTMIDVCTKAVAENDPKSRGSSPARKKKQEEVMECLRAAFMEYLDRAVKENDPNDSAEDAVQQPIAWEVDPSTDQMWKMVKP